ncbi:MAG: DUF222 domain-containing protein [Actinomycetota bacterium]
MTSNITTAAAAVAALGDFDTLDDGDLVSAQRLLASLAREVDTLRVACATVIARRSDPALGFSGLARKNGFVNAESFIQSVTGSTKAEATKLVRVGEMADSGSTWQHRVGTSGVSVDAANAIRLGLGPAMAPDEAVAAAAEKLLTDARSVDADELARRAREARERLDAETIARDEKQRREQRYFTARRHDDGVVRGSFALSDEDGALVMAIYQQATSPRSFGPRFVDTGTYTEPDTVAEDPRTRGQRAADTVAALLRIATETDENSVIGLHRPAVRVHVAAETIARRGGHGAIEDVNDHPISWQAVERHLCSSGVLGIAFDDNGTSLNVGRDQRLYTARQRIALAARDGGCRFPDCDRPVSWTEAHHINYWARDGGETNIDDGILLCRLHHLLVHDNHWQIRHDHGDYLLTPPPDIDPTETPRPMPSKQPLVRELQAAR